MHCPLDVPSDHPSFQGHFPAFPVLPGAVLLDEALQAIERARGIDLKIWKIASLKFLDVVRPGDALRLEHSASKAGAIRFTVRAAARVVASGTLSAGTHVGSGA